VPARAIAKETIRRAKYNFGLIVERLRRLDYQFGFDPLEDDRSRLARFPTMMETVAGCEKAGLLVPIVLQEVAEKIWVKLLGTHPMLCPPVHAAMADPVIIGVEPVFNSLLEAWVEGNPEDLSEEQFQIEVCASPISKTQFMNQEQAEHYYTIQLPDGSADAVLIGEPAGRTLVEYLRWSFMWGGFPGWGSQKDRPEKELAFLREGLLRI
jgi:hypothetical protein